MDPPAEGDTAMIPNHLLNDLGPEDRVAVLARGGELHFLVHAASDDREVIRSYAARDGSEVLATHMQNKDEILRFVASRERDVGGEG
jgi:hypothetical protein